MNGPGLTVMRSTKSQAPTTPPDHALACSCPSPFCKILADELRSGSLIRCTRTVLPISILTDRGVIKIYCFLSEAFAVSICQGSVSE